MVEQEIIIGNILGIHARPAALIANTAVLFDAEIWLVKDGKSANAKSIMEVMVLAVEYNTMVTVRARGTDEKKAVDALVALFASNFDE